jgi:hypothetical protein
MDRPRDFWMCGHPEGCEEEPLWVPLTAERPYCRVHDRAYERFSEIAKRPQARAATMGKRGGGDRRTPRIR